MYRRSPFPVHMTNWAVTSVLGLACVLSACSTGSYPVLQTLQSVVARDAGIAGANLNPNFRYLRVTIEGRVVLLALGDVDKDAHGPVEVWYSAEREVLRFQNGRLVGAVGLTTEWRSVLLPDLPSWSALARSNDAFRWTRTRDTMPGYRFGLKDALSLRVVADSRKSALKGLDPESLTWFEERVETVPVAVLLGVLADNSAVDLPLPPARYAVDLSDDKETVVYGEQCLRANLCFTWQRWPVQPPSATGK
jgi:hypothetical protein